MRFGDPDVEVASRVSLGELRQAGAVGHRRGDADDARIAVRRGDHRVGEGLRECRAAALLLEPAFVGSSTTFGPTPWNVRASLSAGSKPLPLTVRTCSSTGPGILRAFEMMSHNAS